MQGDQVKEASQESARPGRGRRVFKSFLAAASWLLIAIGAVLIGASLWIERTFGSISVDQMLMHLPGAGGAESTGSEGEYLRSFLSRAVIIPLLIVGGVYVTIRLLRIKVRDMRKQNALARSGPIRAVVAGLLSLSVLAGGVLTFGETIHLRQFAQAAATASSMNDYYVAPDLTSAASFSENGAVRKNLITIYLESTEESFSDETLFETDMMAPLNSVTSDWSKFDALNMYDGSGWTMAGIAGTECGVPLRGLGNFTFGENHNDIGADNAGYMPGAVCIGDVLKAAGYENVFLGGAESNFAAKSNYLKTHGYDKVMGLVDWQSLGETEVSPVWGLSDRRLMENAKQEVTRLHDQKAPFSLTLLTLDIHEPLNVFDSCPVTTQQPGESVQRCSAEAVAGFISYLEEEGYLEDTAVFITGDHEKLLAEGVAFDEQLNGRDNRVLYNRLWSPDPIQIERGYSDQLSVYATLLDVLGLGREDGRAGVGVSALIPENEATGMPTLSSEQYLEVLRSRSTDLYERLWNGKAGAESLATR